MSEPWRGAAVLRPLPTKSSTSLNMPFKPATLAPVETAATISPSASYVTFGSPAPPSVEVALVNTTVPLSRTNKAIKELAQHNTHT